MPSLVPTMFRGTGIAFEMSRNMNSVSAKIAQSMAVENPKQCQNFQMEASSTVEIITECAQNNDTTSSPSLPKKKVIFCVLNSSLNGTWTDLWAQLFLTKHPMVE